MATTTATETKTLVNYRVEDGIAVIELSDPPANTYTYEMNRQIDECILKARMDNDVYVLLLTGTGDKFFSAGANIKMLSSVDPTFKYYFCLHANETLLRLEHTPKLVIAAITTDPCRIENFTPFISTGTLECWPACSSGSVATTEGDNCGDAATCIACFAAATAATVPVRSRSACNASLNIRLESLSGTRSCGRLGPARLGSTVRRSSSSVSLKFGSGVSSVRKIPCVLQYASTNCTCDSSRPVNLK